LLALPTFGSDEHSIMFVLVEPILEWSNIFCNFVAAKVTCMMALD
jgi:hypothetical protein